MKELRTPEEKPMFRTEFRITKGLTDDGLPTYVLHRDFHTPFTDTSRPIARNADREVLERAIKFLEAE